MLKILVKILCGVGGGTYIQRKVYYTVGCWGPYDLTMMTLVTVLLKN